ncbi:MAG TPA: lipase family protein, partial [Roseiarcus sp.]
MATATLTAASPAQDIGFAGKLISAEAMAGAPEGTRAYRILYWSTGLDGNPVEVSGVVIAPRGPPPPGGRPVVAWAHPTTGVVSRCAPSLARVFFASIQGLRAMLDRGYVVAATDYPGLGTPEVHPYLVGTSEAHAVLDSVRAARAIPEAAA